MTLCRNCMKQIALSSQGVWRHTGNQSAWCYNSTVAEPPLRADDVDDLGVLEEHQPNL